MLLLVVGLAASTNGFSINCDELIGQLRVKFIEVSSDTLAEL